MSVTEVLDLHRRLIEQSGGSPGLRGRGALVSAVRQPQMEFGGEELYSSLTEKAAALGFALVRNHPFVVCGRNPFYTETSEQATPRWKYS
ncbi:type II toxin-antitoxin system death-on-curing family toxin [Salinibacter ruber]|uniref:type II toxin-antitoxin system death-on-curing family toxin n=1 Tax=Salinibacter ruber TaxID=146919 RepID=UPI003C6EA260